MRFAVLIIVVLAMIFASLTSAADKGYRKVSDVGRELTPRFAEYDSERWYVAFDSKNSSLDSH
jgi:hypothetical protein